MYTILIEKNGVALVVDTNASERILAYVNGNYYRVQDGRPCGGNGRQLREDTRRVIADMLDTAKERRDALVKAERERLEKAAMEAAEKASETPRVNFADALQDAFLKTLTEKAAVDMTAQIYPAVEKMVTEKFGLVPVLHEIKIPDKTTWETTEVLHKDFDKIISILTDDRDGKEAVYLCGPAGTGKSFIGKQAAKALNTDFYYTNSVTDDVQIKGFVDANGRYHETEFYRAFVNGGVFLLDEMDGSIPETLIMLNNALANGYFTFPNGKVEVHKNFYCIATGNTFGTGADATYTGRYQLDGSSMDRFSLVNVDYDERIETAMANGDKELVKFAHDFRKAVEKTGVSCLCTYRAIKRLSKFSAYMEKPDAIRISLTKGLPADDIRLISKNISGANSWKQALDILANA